MTALTQCGPAPAPTPRPYLIVVKALGLESVVASKSAKGSRPSRKDLSAQSSAANSSTFGEGGRNRGLASVAGTLRRKGMAPKAIDAALQAINLESCKPPLDGSEVSAIARSIGNYAAPDAATVLHTLTDVGNAARFGHRYGEDLRYVVGMGWFIWNGSHWRPDGVEKVVEMAKQVAGDIYSEGDLLADPGARVAIAQHAKASQNVARIKAMIELAKSLPTLVSQPSALDADDMLIGVANGVIDLRTGKLRPTLRADLITRHSPVVFDAKAKCPRFEQFIGEVTAASKQLASYLQRVIGYALTGDVREQCLFFMHGSGSNGKSVLLNVIKNLLGSDLAKQTPSETLMTKRSSQTNDIARLDGLRVVIANEIDDGTLLSEALVKQMTGGDTMSARFHYREFFDFKPKLKLLMAGNHKPVIQGRDNGIWRRIRLISFEVTFEAQSQDKTLQAKLNAELPGILNWAIKGCLAWQKQGLAAPVAVTQAVEAYKVEMDVISQWMDESCTIQAAADWKVSDAYCSYRNWAANSGYRPMARGMFSRDLELRFPKQKRNDATYFLGITGR